jgi:hypothetical protein
MVKREREDEKEDEKEEDEELIKRISQVIKHMKKNPQVEKDENETIHKKPEIFSGKKSVLNVENLIDTLTDTIKHVIRNDGFTLTSDKDGMLQFQGVILHPYEMTYALLKSLLDCGQKFQGALWIDFEPHPRGMMVKVYFTQEASLIMAKTKKDQIEDVTHEQQTKIEKPPTDELGILGHSLVKNLDVDRTQKPKFKTRPTGGSLFVLNCTVVLANVVSARQIQRIFQGHADNIKSLTWGKHLTLPKLFISLEVGSPTAFPETII